MTTHEDKMMEVEVDRLTPHPKNPRRGDVPAIAQSLERHGQVKPIIVQRSTGYVVAGNHTLLAAKSLGWRKVRILVKDMSDDDALSYLLADNRTTDKSGYDDADLYDALRSLGSIEGSGYTQDDIDLLADVLTPTIDDDFGDPVYIGETADEGEPGEVKAPAEVKEPMRDIVMLMTLSDAQQFGQEVAALQKQWGTRTVVETVRRAVTSCVAAEVDA